MPQTRWKTRKKNVIPMKIDILSQEDKKLKFVVEDVTPAFLNTMRRIATTEVPTMAIEEVMFTKNSSVLYDEVVAHRLGLIPLSTDLKTYRPQDKCKCGGKGCDICQLKLTLSAKGPKVVYSGELKSKDPKVKPVYDDIPIMKLTENQEVKLTAIAVLGKGKEHAKWTTGLLTFQGYPEIKIQSGKNRGAAEIAAACPRGVLEVKDGSVKVANLEACNLCKACQEKAQDIITVDGSKEKFIVTLESWGQLSPKEILEAAADEATAKFKEFDKLIK